MTALLKTGYAELIERFPLKKLASDTEYRRAAAIVDELALRGEDVLDRGEREYLDALAVLLDAYDAQRMTMLKEQMADASLLIRLRKLMELSGKTSAEMGDLIGSRSAFSMALAGTRELSKEHIRKLAAYFKLSTDYFLA